MPNHPAMRVRGMKDGSDDGKEGHDLVLLDLNLGLVQFPDLQQIFLEHLHMAVQTVAAADKQLPASQFPFVQLMADGGLHLIADIHHLLIEGTQGGQFPAIGNDCGIEGTGIRRSRFSSIFASLSSRRSRSRASSSMSDSSRVCTDRRGCSVPEASFPATS